MHSSVKCEKFFTMFPCLKRDVSLPFTACFKRGIRTRTTGKTKWLIYWISWKLIKILWRWTSIATVFVATTMSQTIEGIKSCKMEKNSGISHDLRPSFVCSISVAIKTVTILLRRQRNRHRLSIFKGKSRMRSEKIRNDFT